MSADADALDDGVAVRFETVHRSLALFAHALAGRPLALQMRAARMLGSRAIDTVPPDDDDATLHLPHAIADYASRRDNHGAWRIAVLREIGLRIESEPSHAEVLRGFDSWPRRRLLRRVFSMLETLRVDSAIARRYPGARDDLARVRGHASTRRPNRPGAQRPMHGVVDALRRFGLGVESPSLPALSHQELTARVLVIADASRREGATTLRNAQAALAICACLDPTHGRLRAARTQALQPSDAMALPQSTGARPGTAADAPTADSANASHDAPAGAWLDAPSFQADVGKSAATDSPRAPRDGAKATTTPGRSFFYDEWDSVHQRYLPDWCHVHERRLRGDDLRFLVDLRERHAALGHRVRSQFAAIRPAWRERVHGLVDGEDIDIDRLIDERIERHAGQLAEGRVFSAQQQPRRDVCAAFLVDMSGSTGFLVPLPKSKVDADKPDDEDDIYFYQPRAAMAPSAKRPPRRRVIDIAQDAMGLMCDALHGLGDRHAVYGFSGDGRHRVDIHVAKDFNDAWSARTAAALAAMQPMRATRTGAAIRHAVARLKREPARTRVLIVVSDGYPQDADYGPDARDPGYGIRDTARALREAEQAGIAAFCITVDQAGHDYLREMAPAHRYLVIDDVEALPEQLGKVYRALTAR